MNEITFKTGIAYISKMYGKIDDEIVSGYWNILKEYSDKDFKQMIENIIKSFVPTSQVPFPLIPHFLQNIGQAGKNRAKLAVSAILEAAGRIGSDRSISFGDRALHATIERFGGWNEVSHWSQEDWGFREKSFIEMYEANLIDNKGPDHLPGLTELHNETIALSGRQLELAQKFGKAVSFPWKGYQKLLPNNSGDVKKIKNQPGMESISDILKIEQEQK